MIKGMVQFFSLLGVMLLFVAIVVLRVENPDMTGVRFAMEYSSVYLLMIILWFIHLYGRMMK